VRILLRATALALALVCLALGVHLFTGHPLRWTLIGAVALACIALGAVLVLRPRMRAEDVARRLDRRFQLHEQLTTALEVGPQAEGAGAYLYDQARRTLAHIRRQVAAHQRFPWSELALVISLTVLLAGLTTMATIEAERFAAPVEPLPPLSRPADPAERFPEEPFQPPPGDRAADGPGQAPVLAPGPGDAAALAALADALRDQSLTRPAAEALDQGDAAGAARQLRALAGQAGQMSAGARGDLSQALREAAGQLAPTDPGLADQVQRIADGLDAGESQAAEALERLAELVEQVGADAQAGQFPAEQTGQPGASGGGAGQGSLPGQQRERSQRLGVAGVPLELAGAGPGDWSAPDAADQSAGPGGPAGAGGFARGSPSSERIAVEADPLRIPGDLRDVVQDYFSP
jgi:enamine deaminase RidA (YjgF/YER057c/UK114 family)